MNSTSLVALEVSERFPKKVLFLLSALVSMNPNGITKDSSGNLYVAEFGGNCIVRVDINGVVTAVVPKGELQEFIGVAFDMFGNLLVSEYTNGKMKRISPDGKISTLSLVDELGQPYGFTYPISMAVDATGVYVAEGGKYIL